MHNNELIGIFVGLLVVVAAIVTISRRVGIPYPILLVIGGLILGFVPGLPRFELEPEIVLLLFLPPLLYSSAINTSLRDFKANLRPILLLAVGLVISTTVVMAVVAHTFFDDFGWGTAFVLGAILSPTDAIAATAIAQRLGVNRRVVTVLEGESLVNDASALVAYRVAVAAVVTGAFSLGDALLQFLYVSIGGIVLGLAAGYLLGLIRSRLDDPSVENTISLLTPFAVYLPAEALGISGVLAVVACGLYLGWRAPVFVSSRTRVQGRAVWDMLTFLLNGLIFILIGLQLPSIIKELAKYSLGTLITYGVITSLTVILIRILWVFPATYLPRIMIKRIRERDPAPNWRAVMIVAWTGMRGVVSLAVALAVPLTTNTGAEFGERDLIIFLTFCAIFATLVLQGLSLPFLIKWLKVGDDGGAEREEERARREALAAGQSRLDELAQEDWVNDEMLKYMQAFYHKRQHKLDIRYDGSSPSDAVNPFHRLRLELIGAERQTIIKLRNNGAINDEVLHRIERELDLEELRVEA